MSIRVFVYGTLKPGEVNYQRYCEGKVIDSPTCDRVGSTV